MCVLSGFRKSAAVLQCPYMERIDSTQNARVKNWVRLHQKKGRDETGLFLIEGMHLTEEALKAGIVETIITDTEPAFAFEHIVLTTPAVMHKLSQNPSGAHVIAVCRQLKKQTEGNSRILILDDIQDPGSLGTLIRTAVSFSFDAVYCSEKTCDLYNEKVIRATQGALFAIPVIRTDVEKLTAELQRQGVQVVATTLQEADPMSAVEAQPAMAFILGNEGNGVRPSLQKAADRRLKIEMNGFESLNVAVAGGIIMYRYRGQK